MDASQQAEVEKQQHYLKLSMQRQRIAEEHQQLMARALVAISAEFAISLSELSRTCSPLLDDEAKPKLGALLEEAQAKKRWRSSLNMLGVTRGMFPTNALPVSPVPEASPGAEARAEAGDDDDDDDDRDV